MAPNTANGHSPVTVALTVSRSSPIPIEVRYAKDLLDMMALVSNANAASTSTIPRYAPTIVNSMYRVARMMHMNHGAPRCRMGKRKDGSGITSNYDSMDC